MSPNSLNYPPTISLIPSDPITTKMRRNLITTEFYQQSFVLAECQKGFLKESNHQHLAKWRLTGWAGAKDFFFILIIQYKILPRGLLPCLIDIKLEKRGQCGSSFVIRNFFSITFLIEHHLPRSASTFSPNLVFNSCCSDAGGGGGIRPDNLGFIEL